MCFMREVLFSPFLRLDLPLVDSAEVSGPFVLVSTLSKPLRTRLNPKGPPKFFSPYCHPSHHQKQPPLCLLRFPHISPLSSPSFPCFSLLTPSAKKNSPGVSVLVLRRKNKSSFPIFSLFVFFFHATFSQNSQASWVQCFSVFCFSYLFLERIRPRSIFVSCREKQGRERNTAKGG